MKALDKTRFAAAGVFLGLVFSGGAFVGLRERERRQAARQDAAEALASYVSRIEERAGLATALAWWAQLHCEIAGQSTPDLKSSLTRLKARAIEGLHLELLALPSNGSDEPDVSCASQPEGPRSLWVRGDQGYRVLLCVPCGKAPASSVALSLEFNALLEPRELEQLVQRGYDYEVVALDPRGRSVSVARSSAASLVDPLRRTLSLSGTSCDLLVAPRLGWGSPSRKVVELLLVTLLASLAGLLTFEKLQEPQILRDALKKKSDHLKHAREEVTREYTERRLTEEKRSHEAVHDALTSLPNRAHLLERIDRALALRAGRSGPPCAVLFFGIDRFQLVNDSRGPLAGDQLIKALARRAEMRLGPDALLARVGGDQFAALLSDFSEATGAVRLADGIREEIRSPFLLGGDEVFTSASVGVALSTDKHVRGLDLLRDAELAMHRAKSAGGDRLVVFDEDMHRVAVDLLELESDLRRAVDRGEFRAYYQPILDLTTGSIVALETLIRWQHPIRGLVSPAAFIPLAEQTGLIIAVDRWNLAAAVKDVKNWQDKFPRFRNLHISANLSVEELSQPDLIDFVRTVLDYSGLDPATLSLEITESGVMKNAQASLRVLEGLRSLGLRLHVDDFGTGYSSLAYLHRFPFDCLKVDRAFVSTMVEDERNRALVRTIVTLAHTLGLHVTAEGIETEEQYRQLRELGCELGQGFLFSRPIPAADMEEMLARDPVWRVSSHEGRAMANGGEMRSGFGPGCPEAVGPSLNIEESL